MKRLFVISLLGCLICITGCATRALQVGGVTTYDGLSGSCQVEALAANTALELARRYPPGRTSLALVTVPGQFGEQLETSLRGHGFTLTGPDGPGVRVGYVLDTVQEEAVPTGYLQVMTSDGQRFGFVERLIEASPVPPSAVSVADAEPLPPSALPVATPLTESPMPMASAPPASSMASTLPTVEAMPSGERFSVDQTYPVRKTASAAEIARRNGVSVRDFCAWNGLTQSATVSKGQRVLLQQPRQRAVAATAGASPASSAVSATSSPVTAAALSDLSAVATAPMTEPVTPAPDELVVASAQSSSGEEAWSLRPAPLNNQLGLWAERAGYQLVWQAENDYLVEFHASFRGTFVGALQQLFSALHKQGVPLRVTLYEENTIIKVTEE